MEIADLCKIYLNGFEDISNYKKNNAETNVLAALKILSYFTGVILLGVVAVYGVASLCGRVSKKEALSSQDKDVNDRAKKQLKLKEIDRSKIIETSKKDSYTGDLTLSQKSKIQTNFINNNILQINFQEFQEIPNLNITIRQQDIFVSGAQVIINAANDHLGGGGGIDGQIHKKGGSKYVAAHRELQRLYNSKYVLGHAALIESGSLKEDYNIDSVIVVAGPQGVTSPKKESELYFCYYNSLVLAENQNKTSIAFPSISTGLFRFPQDRAACISLKAIYDFINKYPNTKLKDISIHFLVSLSNADLKIYEKSCNTGQNNQI